MIILLNPTMALFSPQVSSGLKVRDVEMSISALHAVEQAVASTEVTASSSAKRERCPYREFCYRKNPIHLQEAIHPGDRDWQTEEDNATTKLPCPYGDQCYRKNAEHLNEYEHRKTSSTDQAQRPTAKRKGKVGISISAKRPSPILSANDETTMVYRTTMTMTTVSSTMKIWRIACVLTKKVHSRLLSVRRAIDFL